MLGALPVVKAWRGHLPGGKSGKDGALTTGPQLIFEDGRHATDAYEEAMRTLRDSILLPHLDNPPRTLLMTSATPREGKTTTGVHLAVVHSQQRRRTLLIDADLRRPSVYGHLGVLNDRGLSDVVNGKAEWRELLQTPQGLPDLAVLPAGRASRRAADGLGKTLKTLLDDAAGDFDLIVLDAPPLLGFAESLQIAALVDAIVVVALAGRTQRPALASVVGSLRRLNANVAGIVLNEVRQDLSDRYYYYGYYGKYYGNIISALKTRSSPMGKRGLVQNVGIPSKAIYPRCRPSTRSDLRQRSKCRCVGAFSQLSNSLPESGRCRERNQRWPNLGGPGCSLLHLSPHLRIWHHDPVRVGSYC